MTYHEKPLAEVLSILDTTQEGLSTDEAGIRLDKYGENKISEQETFNLLKLIFKQLQNYLVLILVVAAIISFLTNHIADALVIFLVIAINLVISIFQEYRADKSINALKKLLITKAKVYRDGKLREINSIYLVPGDIIYLEEGDKVPADARVFYVSNFSVNEASITGESVPESKVVELMPAATSVNDQKNIIWMGTIVSSGKTKAIVTSTGSQTLLGSIATEIQGIDDKDTYFAEITNKLAKTMAFAALGGSIIIFLIGIFIRGFEFIDVFLFSIAMLVSAIPEGLPAVLAIVLAIGAYRMAQKKAVVRNLSESATLGIVNVILTDKTGTLTQNKMTVEKLYLSAENLTIDVTGDGWDPKGDFLLTKPINIEDYASLQKIVEVAYLCNNSRILFDNGRTEVIGDPTEAALEILGLKAGLREELKNSILFDLPFNSDFKTRGSIIKRDSENELFVIGAPEKILALSSEKSSEHNRIEQEIIKLSKQSYRVLGVAYKGIDSETNEMNHSEIKNMKFLGLIAMRDPIRLEVPDAIQKAKKAGIKVVMLTGDYKETALTIARDIGLIPKTSNIAFSEEELTKFSDKVFEEIVLETQVLARLTPHTKLRIAQIFQKHGYTIAMTGDGVNDAPALKQADIGISMGITGTDTAREASEIVLTDDNFATIISAIDEAKVIFANIRRSSTFLITTGAAEQITIIISMLLGFPLPLLPAQILWLNLVTDGVSDMALATEKRNSDIVKLAPKSKKEGVLSRKTITQVATMSIVMTALTIFFFAHYINSSLEEARTAAFLCMAFTQLFNAFNLRSFTSSIFKIGFFSNKFVFIGVIASAGITIAAVYMPFFQNLLGFTYIEPSTVLLIIVLSSVVLWVGEATKFLSKHR